MIKAFFLNTNAARTPEDRKIAREVRNAILAKKRIKKYPKSGEAMLARLAPPLEERI